ncbi:hypothetical protein QF034_004172 [Streptomyces africanus]|uniref:Uncharacterized protein n=1 Tax=Streptomyces africanus TaxID=231024 RepID=A0ABU0QRC5_9ACTN|nr:hypothetical protein [Streptomyces africanus]
MDELAPGVGAVADRARAAQDGQAEGGDEVGVAGTADGGVGQVVAALRIDRLPQTRLVAHVASDMSVLATGLVPDRSALAFFVDHELAEIPGILTVSVDVMLAEPRRYWLDRDLTSGLGEFHAPPLL